MKMNKKLKKKESKVSVKRKPSEDQHPAPTYGRIHLDDQPKGVD